MGLFGSGTRCGRGPLGAGRCRGPSARTAAPSPRPGSRGVRIRDPAIKGSEYGGDSPDGMKLTMFVASEAFVEPVDGVQVHETASEGVCKGNSFRDRGRLGACRMDEVEWRCW